MPNWRQVNDSKLIKQTCTYRVSIQTKINWWVEKCIRHWTEIFEIKERLEQAI